MNDAFRQLNLITYSEEVCFDVLEKYRIYAPARALPRAEAACVCFPSTSRSACSIPPYTTAFVVVSVSRAFLWAFMLPAGFGRPHERSRNAYNYEGRCISVYGGIDQSWKVSWAPHLLLGSTTNAPMDGYARCRGGFQFFKK